MERGSLDERLEAAIKALSTEALDANSARFLELAETHLSGHVRPLKDSLARMDQQLQSVERVRQEAYGALTEGVRQLRTDQEKLRTETGNLVTALRTPHVRGRWGEIQLRRRRSRWRAWSSTATSTSSRRRRTATGTCFAPT